MPGEKLDAGPNSLFHPDSHPSEYSVLSSGFAGSATTHVPHSSQWALETADVRVVCKAGS